MPVSALNFSAAASLPKYTAATVAPDVLRALAIAAPMPRVPPVTTATLAMMLPSRILFLWFADQITPSAAAEARAHSLLRIFSRMLQCMKKSPGLGQESFPRKRCAVRLALNAHGNAHAAADTQRGEPLVGVAARHLVEERHQHARARGADRMTDSDGTAVDVYLRRVPAHVLVDGTRLRGKSFVGLDEIEFPHG